MILSYISIKLLRFLVKINWKFFYYIAEAPLQILVQASKTKWTRGGYANGNAGSKTRVLRLRAFSLRHFRDLRSAFLDFP